MSTRITQSMISDRMLLTLQQTQARVAQLTLQAQTGSKINKPSDDPLGTQRALRARDDLGRLQAYRDSAADASGWLSTADTALQGVTDLLHRAHELTVTAASDTSTPSARAAAAQELGAIIESVKAAGNATFGDSYVFAGQPATTKPYQQGATDTFAGTNAVVARTIGPGASVQVNATGDALFGSGGGDGKLLDVLRTLQSNLQSNNAAGLQADLSNLDTQLDAVSGVRATLGATQNRVDAADARAQDATLTATDLLGGLESADFAETLTQLSLQQTAYTAALKTGASVIQTSLLDFLR